MKPLFFRRGLLPIALVVTATIAAACSNAAPPSGSSTSGGGVGDFPAPVKPQWLTKADIEQMAKPFEKSTEKLDALFSDLDFFVLMAATAKGESRSDTIAGSVLLVKYYLHRLFYSVSFDKVLHPADDPEFYTTLAKFERRAGLNVDGKFTVGESTRLRFLADVESEPEIRTTRRLVNGSDTYASAEGTWVLQGEDIAYPVNRSQIQCWRADGRCIVFTANLALPGGRQDDASGFLLMTDVEYYDIVEWGRNQMQARTSSSCRQITLTVNWATEQVHTVATDISKEGCPMVGPLTKPRIATLESGDPIEQFFKTRREMVQRVSNSPLERMRSLLPAPKAAQQVAEPR